MAAFLLFIFLFGLLLLGVPIAVALGLSTTAIILLFTDQPTLVIAQQMFTSLDKFALMAIPLFVLAGNFLSRGGAATRIIGFARAVVGHLPGGLPMSAIFACVIFAAVSGSSPATVAAIGSIMIGAIKEDGYSDSFAIGSIVCSGSLGILIPPSIILIVYGVTVDQSIGKLFMAGILPGILLAGLFMLTVVLWAYLSPEVAPRGPRADFRTRLASLSGLIETLLLFLLVMGGLFLGFFTPTEAGAVGAMGSLLIAVFRRNISWKGFIQSLFETTRISCMILVIVAGATIFGHFLAITRIPFDIAEWVAGFNLPAYAIMALIILVYLVGGCVIDSLALIMLTVPIFYPVVISLGYNPIWFGVVIVLVTQIGVITPPVGVNVYVVSGVARDIPLHVIFKGVVPLLAALIVATLLMLPFPELALWLPNMMH